MMGRMRRTLRTGLPFAAVMICAAAIFAGTLESPARRARDFALEDINPRSATFGKTLELRELYGERGLLLQFVASWCAPCRKELPELQELHEQKRTPVVLVAADEYGYTQSILIVAEQTGVTAPILFVPEEQAEELAQFYDYEILPATYLIDREGTIREMHEGAWSKARLVAAIEGSLGSEMREGKKLTGGTD